MTNQEAVTKLTNIVHDDHYAWHPSILTAFGMAVDALKGEGDCISRAEAIDAIESHIRTAEEPYHLSRVEEVMNHVFEIAASCVYNLPSAQPSGPDNLVKDSPSLAKDLVNDCINRQAAIDAFMTATADGDKAEWCKWVINQLPSAQPEPCKDAVSREAISEWLKQYGQDVLHGKYEFSLMYIWKNLMDLPSAQPEQRWIPIKVRPMDAEERKEWSERIGYDLEYENAVMFDCPMPDDGQEVWVCSKHGNVWQDTCQIDEGMYLEGNGDWIDIVAWMPFNKPEPYREDGAE